MFLLNVLTILTTIKSNYKSLSYKSKCGYFKTFDKFCLIHLAGFIILKVFESQIKIYKFILFLHTFYVIILFTMKVYFLKHLQMTLN